MRIITFSLSVNFLGRPERALIFFIFDATQRIVDFLLFTILPISSSHTFSDSFSNIILSRHR